MHSPLPTLLSPRTPLEYLTPTPHLCVNPYVKYNAPFKFRATRTNLEVRQERLRDRVQDGENLQQGMPRTSRPPSKLKSMMTLMEICRAVIHISLQQDFYEKHKRPRTRLEAEEQVEDSLSRIIDLIPVEIAEYLCQGGEFFFHSAARNPPPIDWEAALNDPSFSMIHNGDRQACAICLRGSQEPNNLCIRTILLAGERLTWSPSESFTGISRKFFTCWTCSKDCYWRCKSGNAILAVEGHYQVHPTNYPPHYLSTDSSTPTLHVSVMLQIPYSIHKLPALPLFIL